MWGIEVRGASGVLQIDQDYANLHLVKKATVMLTTRSGSSAWNLRSTVTIQETGNNPLVAFRANVPVLQSGQRRVSSNAFSFTFDSTAAAGGSLTYYLFDTAPASSGGWGLEVYTPDQKIAFTSNRKYLRVSGQYSSANFGGTGGPSSAVWNFPQAGRTYAVIQSKLYYFRDHRGDERWEWGSVVETEATRFTINKVQTFFLAQAGSGQAIHQVGARYMFVDVTGY